MPDPVQATNLTIDLSSLLMGGGGTATGSAVLGYFLSQWKNKRCAPEGDSTRVLAKLDTMITLQRTFNDEFREFIGFMKARASAP